MPRAIIDTTVLSNFAVVGRPDLLQETFPELAAPAAVLRELQIGEQGGRLPVVDWNWLDSITLSADERKAADALNQFLGLGEAECIAVAKSRGWLLLTDDRDARRAALEDSISVSGTIGVLVSLVDDAVLTLAEADKLLARMMSHGYRSPVSSLEDLAL